MGAPMESISTLVVAVPAFLIATFLISVDGHAYMSKPMSRNAIGIPENGLCSWSPTGAIPCIGAPYSMNYEEPISGCGIIQGGTSPWMFGTGPDAGLGFANTGIIADTYTAGQIIRAEVEIGTYHGGIFEFRLQNVGSLDDPVGMLWDFLTPLTVEWFSPTCSDNPTACGPEPCLITKTCAQIPLNPYGGGHNYHVDMDVKLPDGFTCDHCVLQWRYTASNSCPPDFISCDTAEKFWNCADITILPFDGSTRSPVVSPVPSPVVAPSYTPPIYTPVGGPMTPAPSLAPLPWTYQCLCQYATSCTIDSDCCSGQVCFDYGGWNRACIENPVFYAPKPTPTCKATRTSPVFDGSDFACLSDTDCCNPSAKCNAVNRLCEFPSTCDEGGDPGDPPEPTPPSPAPSAAVTASPTAGPTIVPTIVPTRYDCPGPFEDPFTACEWRITNAMTNKDDAWHANRGIEVGNRCSVQLYFANRATPLCPQPPTAAPTLAPTTDPSTAPTTEPTLFPTASPSSTTPTEIPTVAPTVFDCPGPFLEHEHCESIVLWLADNPVLDGVSDSRCAIQWHLYENGEWCPMPLEPSPAPVEQPTSTPTSTRTPTAHPSVAPTPISAAPTEPLDPIGSYNPFERVPNYYVNPSYQASLTSSIVTSEGRAKRVMESMMDISSAYWIDVKSKVVGTGTGTLEGILQDAASKPIKQLVTFMIYDLPNRDCHAKASNGEICCTYNTDGTCNYLAGGDCSAGLREYKDEYIDPIYDVLMAYQHMVEIVLIIEPDSLPNLATNLADPQCGNSATNAAYTEGIAYTIRKFSDLRMTMYLDAGHGGWLGWVDNMRLFVDVVLSMDFPIQALRGFATNVANYQPIGTLCPFLPSGDQLRNDFCLNGNNQAHACCEDPCGLLTEWNPANNELNYAHLLRLAFSTYTTPSWNPTILLDTGRNGMPGSRSDCANWCNARGAGVGVLPTIATVDPDLIDAYFWLKTPGESDGCTQVLPNGDMCPRFDDFCGSIDSLGSMAGEPRAPEAGHWFDYQIKMLAENAVWMPTNPSPTASPTTAPSGPSYRPTTSPTKNPTFSPSTTPTTTAPTGPSFAPTARPTSASLFLSTSGNQIMGPGGLPYRMTGVNWFGFETSTFAFQGLWGSRHWKTFLDQIVAEPMWFNVLRIPFCNEALIPGKMPTGINYYTNADLTGLTSLEVLDQVIAYCDDLGLKVFLDRHSAKAGGLTSEDLWYIPGDTYYTEQRWITDWMMLARRYAGNPTVVGADLFNEPKRTATWTAWREAAQRCGNAIHLVNPDWLIIVEGTGEEDEYGENAWWGGNLKGVATDPVVLTVPNKLVYSAHDYPSTVYNQEWFSHPNYPLNLPDHWRPFWGYLFEQNIAPIIIGEFGTHLRSTSDQQWLDKITDYMDGDFDLDGSVDLEPGRKGISWTFWCLNPNSGDTGGILQSDWMTPELEKLAYLRASMEGAPTAIPSAAPSTATPSAQPSTAQPSEIPSNLPSSMPSIYTCPGPFEEPFTACEWRITNAMTNKDDAWHANRGIEVGNRCSVQFYFANRATPFCPQPPTAAPTLAPTEVPTESPSTIPTANPTAIPTAIPTAAPTAVPSTAVPSMTPSAVPTVTPTGTPSALPTTALPSFAPTEVPTESPSTIPTVNPTAIPTAIPTAAPTAVPSTAVPTVDPSGNPTAVPSQVPSAMPTTALPTAVPSMTPSAIPTVTPTGTPSALPTTAVPSITPTCTPTVRPTAMPSDIPSAVPSTAIPSTAPTAKPSASPSVKATMSPTIPPTLSPSEAPSATPTANPTAVPTAAPTVDPTTNPTAAPTPTPTVLVLPCTGPYPDHSTCDRRISWTLVNRPDTWYEKYGLQRTRCSLQSYFSLPLSGECPSPDVTDVDSQAHMRRVRSLRGL